MKVSIGRVRASSTKAIMMAKAPKTTKAPKAGASSKAKPKAARKPAAPKKAKKEDPAPEPVFHNETRLFFADRPDEHTSELQSLMRTSYAIFCLKTKTKNQPNTDRHH